MKRSVDPILWIEWILVLGFLGIMGLWMYSLARLEARIWEDEIFTLLHISFSPGRIVMISLHERHPPLYALLAWAWVNVFALLRGEPSIGILRLLGIASWGAATLCFWGIGRRLFGRWFALLLMVTVCGGPLICDAVLHARSYALAVPACGVAFLLLLLIEREETSVRENTNTPRLRLLWLAYGFACSVALWSHLLAIPVIGLLGLAWVGLALRHSWRKGYWIRGGLTHLVIGIVYLPWLLHSLPVLVADARQETGLWMTPATVGNFLRVFFVWYPGGQRLTLGGFGPGLTLLLGAAAWLVPLGIWGFCRIRGREAVRSPFLEKQTFLLLLAFVIPVVNVLGLWVAHRLGIAVFHGPRYTTLTGLIWLFGIVGVIAQLRLRFSCSRWVCFLASVPLLIFTSLGFQGQNWVSHSALEKWESQLKENRIGPREPLYILQSELIPYFRATLWKHCPQPIENLASRDAQTSGALVLDFDVWKHMWPRTNRARDESIRFLLNTPFLAKKVQATAFPPGRSLYTLYRLRELQGDSLRALRPPSWGARNIPPADRAVASAHAADQYYFDGWHQPEWIDPGNCMRWTSSKRATLRFYGAVPPGRYLLHVHGFRPPYPSSRRTFRLSIHGEKARFIANPPVGSFSLTLPLELKKRHEPFAMDFRYPLWRAEQTDATSDTRSLGILFEYAWLETDPGGI